MKKAFSKSYRQSSAIVEELVTQFHDQIKARKNNHSSSALVANSITIANQQSIEPFVYQQPNNHKNINEDQKPQVRKFQKRSFSANVYRLPRKHVGKGVDKILIREGPISKNLSFRSFRSQINKQNASHNGVEQRSSKLIPLQIKDQQNHEDRIIDIMRKEKIKTEHYEKFKKKFIKLIPHQFQQQKQEQKRFANSYLTKDHTYSKKGELLEIPKNQKKIKRKTVNDVYPFKLGSQKNSDSLCQPQTLNISYKNCSEQCQKKQQYIFRQKKEDQQNKKTEQPKYSRSRAIKFFELKEDP